MNDLVTQESKELEGLDVSKAAQIKAVFHPMVEMLESFEDNYNEVMSMEISKDTCKKAKRLRLDISKIRTDADKARKIQKEEYLRAGNAIQGVYNILKFAVTDKEEKLKEVETHFERLEAEKIRALQAERELELAKYEVDGSSMDLGKMDGLVWNNFLAGTKGNYEAVKEAERRAERYRIERERKESLYDQRLKALLPYGDYFDSSKLTLDSTEDDFDKIIMDAKTGRTAYLKEQEKIRQENERLRIEAEKAEKNRLAEEKKRAVEKAKQEEALRKEREAREKLERETKEKEDARLKAEKEESDRIASEKKKAESAPDKEKLFSVATKLRATKETVKSPVSVKALEDCALLLENTAQLL